MQSRVRSSFFAGPLARHLTYSVVSGWIKIDRLRKSKAKREKMSPQRRQPESSSSAARRSTRRARQRRPSEFASGLACAPFWDSLGQLSSQGIRAIRVADRPECGRALRRTVPTPGLGRSTSLLQTVALACSTNGTVSRLDAPNTRWRSLVCLPCPGQRMASTRPVRVPRLALLTDGHS